MDLFWYVCFNYHKKFQKEMVKEAGAQTAALGMCCDTRLRLCRTPPSQGTPRAGWGHRSGSLWSSSGTYPSCLSPQPKRRDLFSLEYEVLNLSRKRGRRGMQRQCAEALAGNSRTYTEHKWNIAWMYKGDLSGIPSNLHNITLSCQSVIILPWQVKK